MRIFLSYASQDQEAAKSIYLALRDQGHQVFFDRADLPAGEEYHNRIRQIFQNSHLFIFLISPNAIDSGSYTLTELAIAEKSATKLLPVLLHKTAVDQLPASIKAVTFLETDGSLPGAVAAEVHRIRRDSWRRKLKHLVSASALLGVIIGLVFYWMNARGKTELIGKDGAPAVLIPAGKFIMGDDEDSPRREIFLDTFRSEERR